MTTEDYVSFETAKLLKEKGFDNECNSYYDEFGLVCPTIEPKFANLEHYKRYSLNVVRKWLREVHHIHISVYPFNRELPITENTSYTCDVATTKDSPMRGHLRGTWKTYKKALENAIKYCLENLI